MCNENSNNKLLLGWQMPMKTNSFKRSYQIKSLKILIEEMETIYEI